MIESIKIPVIIGDNEGELEFELNCDVISIKINNKIVCSLDWLNNFRDAMVRALEIWDIENEDN